MKPCRRGNVDLFRYAQVVRNILNAAEELGHVCDNAQLRNQKLFDMAHTFITKKK